MKIPAVYLRYAERLYEADKARILRNIVVNEKGCWVWQKSLQNKGYGKIGWLGGNVLAHRVSYQLFKEPIKKGLHLDHIPICRNPACVNPDHLEPVTPAENNRRMLAARSDEPRKTHCPHGHEYTPENTYVSQIGRRFCKTCRRQRIAEIHRRRREAQPGPGRGSQHRVKTHCPQGHEYIGDNLIVGKNGSRFCRACKKLSRERVKDKQRGLRDEP